MGMSVHPMISNATHGTTFKTKTKILNAPRKLYMTRSQASREAENHGRCRQQTRSDANRNQTDQNASRPTLRIVHHLKNSVSV